MFNIIGLLKGVVDLFGKLTDYFNRKDMENQIKNSYEKDKEIAVLKENEKTRVIIANSEAQVQAAKEAIKNVSKVTEADATLSKEAEQKILSEIVDLDDRKAREEQIKLAKEIVEASVKKQKELEKDAKFNAGEEIVFKG